LTAHTIKVLYVIAAFLEIGGVVLVIIEVELGRRRAKRYLKGRPYFGPTFGGTTVEKLIPNRMRQQRERQAKGVAHEQGRLAEIVLGILTGRLFWRLLGPVLLVFGIVVGTVANYSNTH